MNDPDDRRTVAARVLRPGHRVVHPLAGPATVVEVRRRGGAVVLRCDDGVEGTCCAELLKWEAP